MGRFKIPEILTWCIFFSPPFPRWSCCFPSLSEVWVLRGEHRVLAGLRGLQENQVTPEAHIKSKEDLQWLHWEGGSQRGKENLFEHNCLVVWFFWPYFIFLNSFWDTAVWNATYMSQQIQLTSNCLSTKLDYGTKSISGSFHLSWGKPTVSLNTCNAWI